MDSLDEKFKSRKLIITMLVLVSSFFMAQHGTLTSDLANILISAIGSYSAGNVLAGDNDRGTDKYRSSKFILTIAVITGSCGAALFGVLTASLANVLTACIASYNLAKGYAGR